MPQAEQAFTTRRALLAAGAILPSLAAAPVLAETSATQLLAQRNLVADWINAEPDWGAAREAEREAVLDRIFELERRIMEAPATRDGVTARIGLVLKCEEEGAQLDYDELIRLIRDVQPMLRAL